MEENKRSGETKPSRGLLARQLLELDKNLYERTRTQSFRFYVNDALRDGIVRFGKTRNREWVELVDRVRFSSCQRRIILFSRWIFFLLCFGS